MYSNIFPGHCKLATMTPVFKKDDPLQMKKFKPVNILSTISNVFEKVIAKQILTFELSILNPKISVFDLFIGRKRVIRTCK